MAQLKHTSTPARMTLNRRKPSKSEPHKRATKAAAARTRLQELNRFPAPEQAHPEEDAQHGMHALAVAYRRVSCMHQDATRRNVPFAALN
jgi:hypothetical protein